MVAVPKNTAVVPSGGTCRYQDPDTGVLLQHPYYERLKGMAKQHRVERGLPIPHDWDSFFNERLCAATPRACVEVPDGKAEKNPTWTDMATTFTTSMVRWAREGFPVADYETFKARHRICAGDPDGTPRCPEFTSFKSFGLARCGKCGCASVKLRLATERCPLGKW